MVCYDIIQIPVHIHRHFQIFGTCPSFSGFKYLELTEIRNLPLVTLTSPLVPPKAETDKENEYRKIFGFCFVGLQQQSDHKQYNALRHWKKKKKKTKNSVPE